jgi:hypothetical protein
MVIGLIFSDGTYIGNVPSDEMQAAQRIFDFCDEQGLEQGRLVKKDCSICGRHVRGSCVILIQGALGARERIITAVCSEHRALSPRGLDLLPKIVRAFAAYERAQCTWWQAAEGSIQSLLLPTEPDDDSEKI